MSLIGGAATYTRFRVEGELPINYRQAFLQALRDRAHQEIDPETDDERTIGWVTLDDSTDVDFTDDKVFFQGGMVLTVALRVDTLRVPPAQLTAHLRQAERDYASAMGLSKLTKRDKEEVKERVVAALRRRILPTSKVFQMLWDTHANVVRFESHTPGLLDEFMGLFQDTFGLKLSPRLAYQAITEMDGGEELAERALALVPSDFTLLLCEVA